jgi:hypothetical protein
VGSSGGGIGRLSVAATRLISRWLWRCHLLLNTISSAARYNIMLPPNTVLFCHAVRKNDAMGSRENEQHHLRRRRAGMFFKQ